MNQTGSALYKVGRSKDAKKRLKQLQTGAPFPLELTKTFIVDSFVESSLERTIHRRFARYKTQGEWFDFDNYSIHDVIKGIEILSESVTLIETHKRNELVTLSNRYF